MCLEVYCLEFWVFSELVSRFDCVLVKVAGGGVAG